MLQLEQILEVVAIVVAFVVVLIAAVTIWSYIRFQRI